MSERDEIQLRRLQSRWQSSQSSAGMATLFLGILTLGVAVRFATGPSNQMAGFMVCLMFLLCFSCWRLVSAASKVVEISRLLSPARVRAQVIEAEVVDA